MLRNVFWHSLEVIKLKEKTFSSEFEKPSMCEMGSTTKLS
jgi:hypothetical protein